VGNEEVLDAMAEVTNMIIGNVKSLIENDYGAMGLSIPTVIYGRNYKARSTGAGEWTVVPFSCGAEVMEIKICLLPGSESGVTRADVAAQNAF
jgi:chemotaxis protein CheX